MDITPLVPQGQQIIQSYAGGRFRISNRVYDTAVVVFPQETRCWNADRDFSELSAEDFSQVTEQADKIDVVLMGCGKTMLSDPTALRKNLKARGVAIEFMDTGAACRTYNVLMAEGRRVAAILLPV